MELFVALALGLGLASLITTIVSSDEKLLLAHHSIIFWWDDALLLIGASVASLGLMMNTNESLAGTATLFFICGLFMFCLGRDSTTKKQVAARENSMPNTGGGNA